MRSDTLANLFFQEIQEVHGVERQIKDALSRIAEGVPVRRLSRSIVGILESTERHVWRLDRIRREIAAAHDDALARVTPQARRAPTAHRAPLSSRQVEVLRLIANGYANKKIAAELSISIKTVEKHRQNMMAKLDLHDTAGVTRYAISTGIVEAIA
jgi:DNA-binding NarL/FixJ family response regulator